MKRVVTILFLLIIFSSQIGYYCLVSFQQYQVRREMKRQILASTPDEYLEVFDAGQLRNEIHWEEEGHEFSYKGNLYDVVRIAYMNGHALIFCINDIKEEQLLDKLVAAVKSGIHNGSHHKSAKHSIKLQWAECSYDAIHLLALPSGPRLPFGETNAPLLSCIVEINPPPPKV